MSQETYWVTKKLMNGGISAWYETYYIPAGNALIKNSQGISYRTGTRTQVIEINTDLPDKVSFWVQKVEPPVAQVTPVKPPISQVESERYETYTITRQIELDNISISSDGIDIYLVAKYYYNGCGYDYDSD